MDPRKGLMPFDNGAFVRRFFNDFDRLFEDTGRPWFKRRTGGNEFAWVPEVEVGEKEGRMFVRVDLPGVKKEEVTVTVKDEYLTIEGERKREVETKKDGWFETERTYGKFVRVIPLPEEVKTADIGATFEHGVLEVTVPLPAAVIPAEPQRIPIGGAAEKKEKKVAA